MENVALKAVNRQEIGKAAQRVRRAGSVPAVLYGHKVASRNISLNALEFRKVFSRAGESTVISLEVENEKPVNVIVHDIQTDPLTGEYSHVDLFQLRMDEKIEAEIPLEFVGESKAVKELGGVLVKSLDKVEVKCLPADLPHTIEVDLALIASFDNHIKVSNLKVSEKVEIISDLETIVALVERPRTDEELAKLNEKVEMDVTKVQGVVKETPVAEETKE